MQLISLKVQSTTLCTSFYAPHCDTRNNNYNSLYKVATSQFAFHKKQQRMDFQILRIPATQESFTLPLINFFSEFLVSFVRKILRIFYWLCQFVKSSRWICCSPRFNISARIDSEPPLISFNARALRYHLLKGKLKVFITLLINECLDGSAIAQFFKVEINNVFFFVPLLYIYIYIRSF